MSQIQLLPVPRSTSYRAPTRPGLLQRQFPTNSATWTAAFPTVAAPTNLWTFQDAASPLADGIGSEPLSENTAGPLYRQTGDNEPGLQPRLATTVDTTGRNWQPGGATFGDINAGTAWTMWIRFGQPDSGATTRGVVSKGDNAPRWVLNVTATTGTLRWDVRDTGTGIYLLTGTTPMDAVGFHDVFLVYDPANTLFRLIVDGVQQDSLSSASFLGTTNPTFKFHIGQPTSGTVTAGTQYSYAAHWSSTALTLAETIVLRTPIRVY